MWANIVVEGFRLMLAQFGEPVRVSGVDVQGIYSHNPGDALGMQGYAPTLEIVAADVSAGVFEGDSVTCRGKSYTVGPVTDDGDGVLVIRMMEA